MGLNQSFNGSALNVVLVGQDANGKQVKILARGSNFTYTRRFSYSNPDELNTTHVQETNLGREELGTGRIAVVFTLNNNDALPSADTIRSLKEFTILEITGDDHPLNDSTKADPNVVMNAFIGARIVGESSGSAVNQTKMIDVEVIFRRKLSGAMWKAQQADAVYPAN